MLYFPVGGAFYYNVLSPSLFIFFSWVVSCFSPCPAPRVPCSERIKSRPGEPGRQIRSFDPLFPFDEMVFRAASGPL